MDLSEFKNGIQLLRGAYGERVFPKERESVLWGRYKNTTHGNFKVAVDFIILKMPQPHAILEWLDDKLGTSEKPQAHGSVFNCEPCRDFGFGFVSDTVTACTCQRGHEINPAELARQQGNYDRGRRYLRAPFSASFPSLPYDPNEREGA